MSDGRGLSGDRRRNPFPSLNDTEYELLMSRMSEAAENGAKKAIADHLQHACDEHKERTRKLEVVLLGDRELEVVGVVQQTDDNAKAIASMRRLGWVLLGSTVSAVALAVTQTIVELLRHVH
jgi:hypothetical protein